MDIAEETIEGIVVLSLTGHLDTSNCDAFTDRVVKLLEGGAQRVVIDFGAVEYLSSGGFRALLIIFKRAKTMGRGCLLCRVEGKVRELFKVGRFLEMFPIKETREDALASLR